ncbi:MAG: SLATT domain-containing protein [Kineosporiaceae bacterium]|nr:SLATT domain-containing protein [Kineosporiaceae bacterium]
MTTRQQDFHRLYGAERIGRQLAWYRSRSEEYRAAHDQASLVRNGLLWLAALCGVAGTAPVGGTARVTLGLTAAALAALATVVTGFETLMDFDAVRKLYLDAQGNLERAEIDWEAGGPDDAGEIVDRVEDVLESENGRWGQLLRASVAASGSPDGLE